MSLLIKNGEIVTADSHYKSDIYVEDQTITRIGKNLEAPPNAEVVDAEGKYVFPGFIDPHVHIYLPFMGTVTKDTHETGSKAGLVGGTTTFIEMMVPNKNDDLLEGFELWTGKAKNNAASDYTFHMGVPYFNEKTESQLKEIIQQGIASFKIFLAYKGVFGVDDEELYNTLTFAKKHGIITTAHCENETLVSELRKLLMSQGKTGPEYHEPSRPAWVEAAGVKHFTSFLETTGAEGYIVHLSSEQALNEALRAKNRGVKVSIETLIQYLLLDSNHAELPNFEGSKYVMSPPLRIKSNQKILWNGLERGLIDTVATDHAPFDFKGQKDMGKGDFTKIPNGIPGIEDRVNLLYTYGVKRGNLNLNQMVSLLSTKQAQLFDMFPRKGTIQPGSDADLVVYDPNYRGKISAKTQTMNVDYSAFEGMEIEGKPSLVTVRGKVSVRDGEFVGDKGWGQLVKREPSHF
ncbi:MAG: dihydropyrimidinase [Spirochaetales bacterium]|nr:dihydropyrimidinase [Spirochaetales bacterium]MCF7938651.1 dihydropyrimidinase [Spirochaetales bacterium]